jgi:hypothetical protein
MRTIYNDIYTLTSDVDWYKNILGKQVEKKAIKGILERDRNGTFNDRLEL